MEFEVERDIDEAREKLMGQKGTPVTYERYMEWRERRKKRKAKEECRLFSPSILLSSKK